MAITTSDNDIKERLSLAYLTAVAAAAGCQIFEPKIDKQSIDAFVIPISGAKRQVQIQLKATSSDIFDRNSIRFDLSIKNYDDLRDDNTNPHYLVVISLPGSRADWLKLTVNDLMICGGAYFGNLYGLPSVGNATSKIIMFPTSQVFNIAILEEMINNAPNRIGTASV